MDSQHSRIGVQHSKAALQKGIKDNSGFQIFYRTIITKITCVTKVKKKAYIWQ
jgi:hypothetical protein